ncbi:MAG: outer membrane beta-barrel protein [Gemmatimonadaceae bacterium]|nr:outer membrane beta-barrel protein [Gemmatimonadaceae bacterium]
MKRSVATLLVAGLAMMPAVMRAQSAKAVSVGVSGGLSLPMGDLSDGYESGFTVAGHIFLKPASLSKVSFRGDVSYDKWEASSIAGSVLNVSQSTLGITGNVLFALSSGSGGMQPYLLGGGGMYRTSTSASVSGLSGSRSSTKPGLQGGAGIEFKLAGFSTFAEAKFVNIFADGASRNYVPITFGVKF